MKKMMKGSIFLMVAVMILLANCNRGKSVESWPLVTDAGVFTVYPYSDRDNNMKGSSMIRMKEKDNSGAATTEKYLYVKGRVTTQYPYGYAGIAIKPDAKALEALRSNIAGIKMRISGDGKQYRFSLDTSNVTDGNTFGKIFNAPKNPDDIEFKFSDLTQEPWGNIQSFEQILIQNLKIQTVGQPISAFNFSIFNIEIIYKDETKDDK
ncbi:MAG: CIA30 family protein [Spirochaetaceae bacterium]|jgi:hypothetical protein|nr:CIA30 family protein [Spirochaetaceae bacterium]